MRAPWILVLVLGCGSPKAWEPRTRENPWELRAFDWLITQQNEDGSWGEGTAASVEGFEIGRVGITGLVLLGAHGFPYTQFSKEELGGRSPAKSIRRALDWLILQRDSARAGSLDPLIAAAALLDNFAWTADPSIRGPALSALAGAMSEKGADGNWGSTLHDWWAMASLGSARFAELPYDEKAFKDVSARLDEEFDRTPGFATAVAPVIRHFRGSREKFRRSLAWVAARPPDPDRPDFQAWYFGSDVVYSTSMNPDPEWRRWTEALERALEKTGNREGYWAGPDRDSSIVRTALVALLYISYQANRRAEFRNVFGPKK